MTFVQVLKFNPNHDPATGRFVSSGGGRQGGTAGAPTENAFGNPLQSRRSLAAAVPITDEWLNVMGIIPSHRLSTSAPESKDPRPSRTSSGTFHSTQTAGVINMASNQLARPSITSPTFTPALHQYVYSHTQAAVPGETVNQYVDRQIALGKIKKQRHVGVYSK